MATLAERTGEHRLAITGVAATPAYLIIREEVGAMYTGDSSRTTTVQETADRFCTSAVQMYEILAAAAIKFVEASGVLENFGMVNNNAVPRPETWRRTGKKSTRKQGRYF